MRERLLELVGQLFRDVPAPKHPLSNEEADLLDLDRLLEDIAIVDEIAEVVRQIRDIYVGDVGQIMRRRGMSQCTNRRYRARFVRKLKVLSEEQLARVAPGLVEVQQVTRLKVDMHALKTAWDSPSMRHVLEQVVNEVEVLDVGEETRKTVREVVK